MPSCASASSSSGPQRGATLGGATVDLRVGPAGDLADLPVGVVGNDQAEGASLGRLQLGEPGAGFNNRLAARSIAASVPTRSEGEVSQRGGVRRYAWPRRTGDLLRPSGRWIDELDASRLEVAAVERHHRQVVSQGGGGDEAVFDRHRLPTAAQLGEQLGPA